MINSCMRCGHVAGAMCPHCGLTDPPLTQWIYIDDETHYYCGEAGGCYYRQLGDIDNPEFDEDQVSYVSAPMTPEEEEMLSADLGIGTENET